MAYGTDMKELIVLSAISHLLYALVVMLSAPRAGASG
jgi:hypothetical protein